MFLYIYLFVCLFDFFIFLLAPSRLVRVIDKGTHCALRPESKPFREHRQQLEEQSVSTQLFDKLCCPRSHLL